MVDLSTITTALRGSLSKLGQRLADGDESELLVWVIPKFLACSHRPLRHHKEFGGSRKDLPPEAAKEVRTWVERMKASGIQGIICLMHPKELGHYDKLNLDAKDLIELYRLSGFVVAHIPWDDPAHRAQSQRNSYAEELARIQVESLAAFDGLPKPVLLHCSAGIDRSAPVAAYISQKRSGNSGDI